MKIKSIIVDDEKHGRENLAGILRQYCPDVDLQAKTLSGFEPPRADVTEQKKRHCGYLNDAKA
jgi:DNA-binding LytR/AlgR family response regulator